MPELVSLLELGEDDAVPLLLVSVLLDPVDEPFWPIVLEVSLLDGLPIVPVLESREEPVDPDVLPPL